METASKRDVYPHIERYLKMDDFHGRSSLPSQICYSYTHSTTTNLDMACLVTSGGNNHTIHGRELRKIDMAAAVGIRFVNVYLGSLESS